MNLQTPCLDTTKMETVSFRELNFVPLTSEFLGFLVVATLSGPGGSVLRVFDSLEGTIIHEKMLHHPQNGQLYSQKPLGVNVAFGASRVTGVSRDTKDLFVLTNGHTVYRIDGTRGDLLWSWTVPEQTFVDDFIPAFS